MWVKGSYITVVGKILRQALLYRGMHMAKFFMRSVCLAQCKERYYVHNIFITNHRWLVVIDLNLNLILRLLFCPTIITSNNLALKICCKNVVKMLWTYNFFSINHCEQSQQKEKLVYTQTYITINVFKI